MFNFHSFLILGGRRQYIISEFTCEKRGDKILSLINWHVKLLKIKSKFLVNMPPKQTKQSFFRPVPIQNKKQDKIVSQIEKPVSIDEIKIENQSTVEQNDLDTENETPKSQQFGRENEENNLEIYKLDRGAQKYIKDEPIKNDTKEEPSIDENSKSPREVKLQEFHSQSIKNTKLEEKLSQYQDEPDEALAVRREIDKLLKENNRERENILRQIRLTNEYKILPWFLQHDRVLDEEMRKPEDPAYDPKTVYLPKNETDRLSPFMRQYWSMKQYNFDKILLFQKGKFYEVYYQDAIIAHYYLKIAWSGIQANPEIPPSTNGPLIYGPSFNNPISVGIHENVLNKHCQELIDLGFQVAIIEQIEDRRETEDRVRSRNIQNIRMQRSEMLVKRQICGIFTKGISPQHGNQSQQQGMKLDYDSKWILAIFSENHTQIRNQSIASTKKYKVGVAFFDNTTLQMHTGQFEDDFNYSLLRALLCQLRPKEVVIDKDYISLEIIKIIKGQPVTPDITPLNNLKERVSLQRGMTIALKYFGNDHLLWPEALKQMRASQAIYQFAWLSFAMLVVYLQTGLIADTIVALCEYFIYDPNTQLKSCMEIDSQASMQLELLETQGMKKEGSLFHYLDQTKTAFGRRMLKKWIAAPLYDIDKINDRLNAVEDLLKNPQLISSFQDHLKHLPDLERDCSSIYKLSMRTNNNSLTFDKLDNDKLRDFYNLLNKIMSINDIINVFQSAKDSFTSKRLAALVTMKNPNDIPIKGEDMHEALFPEIASSIAEFEALIVWQTGQNNEKVPEPFEGIDADYDKAKKRVTKVYRLLEQYLNKIRDLLGFKGSKEIKYAHTQFQRFMLEVPKDLAEGEKRPPDFDLIKTLDAQNTQRFLTPTLKQLVVELEDAEHQVRLAIMPFICCIFGIFHQKRKIWGQMISCLAELDCYCSLASVSGCSDQIMSRPEFIRLEDNNYKPYLELRKMRHPCVTTSSYSTQLTLDASPRRIQGFVPNDTIVGSLINEEHLDDKDASILLLTGPNMGGKSTLLRQTCLAVIIAQLGCYVPADACKLTLVDKIFTRIGASDKLLENKSTFFIEMEETKAILDKATVNSLAVLDELGRGTSTYDGLSIADAVLHYLAENIKCRALFATHYHQLTEKYSDHPQIQNCSMGFDLDAKRNRLVYLYQLRKERCMHSFGINVAQIAGLPGLLIERAREKSEELHQRLLGVYQRYLEKKMMKIEAQ